MQSTIMQSSYFVGGSIGGDLGQMAQDTARTFGVDWPHFDRPVHQLLASWRSCCTGLPTSRSSRCWRSGEKRIAEGLANAEKIKAELASTEAKRAGSAGAGRRRRRPR